MATLTTKRTLPAELSGESGAPISKIRKERPAVCSSTKQLEPNVVPWPMIGVSSTHTRSSRWTPRCHPDVQEATTEIDQYFLDRWNFSDDKARQAFVKAGFSRVICLYFPLARRDRIQMACRLLTVLFLIDDLLEDMSLEDGRAYNDRLMPICRGHVLPNVAVPAEVILYDLWCEMRTKDLKLAVAVLEPTFIFMHAQTDKTRLSIEGLRSYLLYRESDVGKALLSALMRFVMDLHLSAHETKQVEQIEQNCSKHISVVNDIFSWEKELAASSQRHEEGAFLCSSVKVLMDETGLEASAAKRVLWAMVREWEAVHDMLATAISQGNSPNLAQFAKGLEFQMSGNELWSMTTKRYAQSS